MTDLEAVYLFGVATFLALTNVPLLLLPPSRSEQHLWRTLRVQNLRRRLTRRRNPFERHRTGRTIQIARANIMWHAGLSLVLAA